VGIRQLQVAPEQTPQIGSKMRLDSGEIKLAAYVGMMKRAGSMAAGLRDRHGLDANACGGIGWTLDIEGAAAELAFAKSRGLYWPALCDDPAGLPGDVGIAEVRQSADPEAHLILHESDHDERPYVLVIGQIPEFRIVGWIRGAEGKRPQFWRTHTGRPAFFIPQGVLNVFSALV
jgi:hypothetical protein